MTDRGLMPRLSSFPSGRNQCGRNESGVRDGRGSQATPFDWPSACVRVAPGRSGLAGRTSWIWQDRAGSRGLPGVGSGGPCAQSFFHACQHVCGRCACEPSRPLSCSGFGGGRCLVPEEFVGEDVITLVEWPEVAGEVLGRYSYKVYLEHETLETRGLQLVAGGQEQVERWEAAGGER